MPRTSSSAGVQYSFPVRNASLEGVLRGDYSYVGSSKTAFRPLTDPTYRVQPSYALTNLRFSLVGASWETSLFMNNVFDERAEVTHLVFSQTRPDIIITQPPVDYLIDHEMVSRLARMAAFAAPAPNFATRDLDPAEPIRHVPHLYYVMPPDDTDWFGRPVQWNGLRYSFALLKLAEHDASYPWRQIAETIGFAHGKHVVHRNLSPRAILVDHPESANPQTLIMNWQLGYRQAGGGTVAAATERAVLPFEPDIAADHAEVRLRPQVPDRGREVAVEPAIVVVEHRDELVGMHERLTRPERGFRTVFQCEAVVVAHDNSQLLLLRSIG